MNIFNANINVFNDKKLQNNNYKSHGARMKNIPDMLSYVFAVNGLILLSEAHQHFVYINNVKNLDERIIFPQTKWCGDGSVAENELDLGSLIGTDKCCRAHDLCDDVIQSKKSKYGLTNNGPFTLLNCKCDDDFYKCLKQNEESFIDKAASALVGHLFFNVVPVPFANQMCFREDYPVVGCKRRHTILRRCEEYEYDMTEQKKFQWFDRPLY